MPWHNKNLQIWSRRNWLAQATGGLLLLVLPTPVKALSANARALLTQSYGDTEIRFERVALSLPALVENGNSVALDITVDGPMTGADRVIALDMIAPENPNPRIARFNFGPACPRAAVRTRVRMAASQTVVAVAEHSNGTLYGGTAKVVVTEAACLDFLY